MSRLLMVGVVALALSLFVTRLEGTFQMSAEMQTYSAPFPPGIEEQREAEQITADRKNMGMIGGLIGAIVCSSLAFGTLSGTAGSSLKGVMAGLVLGAGLGAFGGIASTMAYRHLMLNPIEPFVDGVLAQACFTVAVGIALAGTLLLTASRQIRRQLPLVLIVVTAITSTLYPFVAAVAFPLMNSQLVLPEGMANRALWLGMPIILSAIAIARSLQPVGGKSTEQLALTDESGSRLVQPELRRLAEK